MDRSFLRELGVEVMMGVGLLILINNEILRNKYGPLLFLVGWVLFIQGLRAFVHYHARKEIDS